MVPSQGIGSPARARGIPYPSTGAAPAMATMPGDPYFQQMLEMLMQALARTRQPRDPSLS
ncbi:unnamed protein product [Prunus armeniaca]